MNKPFIASKANEIRKEVLGDSVPVDVRTICRHLGIHVTDKPIKSEAYFISREGNLAIIVKEDVIEQRKRFSIAHELGHIFLPDHAELVFNCSYNDMLYNTKKPYEQEANFFASELLIPAEDLISDIRSDISIDLISQKAKDYFVSLSAMAIKLTQLTKDAVAVAFIEGNRIKWSSKSDNFGFEVCEGAVDERSNFRKFGNDVGLKKVSGVVDSSVWLKGEEEMELREEIIRFSEFNCSLVVINPNVD